MINCSEVFIKASAFQESTHIVSVQICRQVPPKDFLLSSRCIVIALRAEKTYLVNQTWRMVKWFRYPCYDVECYHWKMQHLRISCRNQCIIRLDILSDYKVPF